MQRQTNKSTTADVKMCESGLAKKRTKAKTQTPFILATKMQVPLKVEDISRYHRMGRPGTGKPRAMICRFLSWRIKRQFMKSRPALKDSKVFVSDDLALARSHLFYLARQKNVQSKCFQCWTFDGNVFLKKAENAAPILVKDSEHIDLKYYPLSSVSYTRNNNIVTF